MIESGAALRSKSQQGVVEYRPQLQVLDSDIRFKISISVKS